MEFFRAREGRNDKDGDKKEEIEFKFVSVALFLSEFPKFGGFSAEAEQ